MNYNITEQIQELNVDVYQQFGILGENKKYLPWSLHRKISNRISKRYEDAVHDLEQMERAEIRQMRRAEFREFISCVKAKIRELAKRFISLFKKKADDIQQQTPPETLEDLKTNATAIATQSDADNEKYNEVLNKFNELSEKLEKLRRAYWANRRAAKDESDREAL